MACPECGEPVRLNKSLVRGSEDTVQKQESPAECQNCGNTLNDESDGDRIQKGI